MAAPNQPLVRADFTIEAPGAGEVVVAIAGCGVCHTDLGYYYDGVPTKHDLPLTLGHEISGHVTAAGTGAEQWIGRSVIVPAVIPCGSCDLCQRGLGNICAAQKMPGNDIQGGFASLVTVPAHGLCPVDENDLAKVDLTLADVSVVADALTTPYQAAVRADVKQGDLAIVIGCGGVGGYAIQITHALGAKVVAIDVDQSKLDAIAPYGAGLTLNASGLDGRALRRAVQKFADENGLRRTEWLIFECSGTTTGQQTAFDLMVPGVTLSVVGFTPVKAALTLSKLMVFHGKALGNWGCVPKLYPDALKMVLDGQVKVAPFVEQHALDDINEVFRAVHAGSLKQRAVLVP
jgi:6-hydroxycyclohex-1-ene-1-carbonyl-CoA dehydrogenase